uniref:Uncharacterized protein n=1 Tax=Physcomitrium patens TaxID=3218 RepID=A0A2K1JDD0_PHYPA|nr:hypothetical protein PHYPA_019819 [Physcomitrium patens]
MVADTVHAVRLKYAAKNRVMEFHGNYFKRLQNVSNALKQSCSFTMFTTLSTLGDSQHLAQRRSKQSNHTLHSIDHPTAELRDLRVECHTFPSQLYPVISILDAFRNYAT